MSILISSLLQGEGGVVAGSLKVPNVTVYAIGQVVDIPVILTESRAGLQFELHYNPNTLTYLSYIPGPGPMPTINASEPGIFKYINVDLSGLPVWTEQEPDNDLGRLGFLVNGSSQLLFVNVLASNSLGQSDPVSVVNGTVNLEVSNMNIGFKWTDPNPAGKVLGWNFYESLDSGNTFTAVLSNVPAADRRLDFDVAADTGEHQFYLIGLGTFGNSAPSNILVVNSAVPQPPVLSFE